ncbi:MAG TPA: TerC family protein [Terriglobales bacterium]|nr:TerC family protein [Terriglobales bacterium]
MNHLVFWVVFNLLVALVLALDLGVFHRRPHTVRFREAMAWSLVWIGLAGGFAVLLYFWRGHTPALEFVTGYIVELSLSVDNLFIFLLVFRYFRVPSEYQYKVLFWGILSAVIMRAVFIVTGVKLIQEFHWITYAFGVLLVYSGIRLVGQENAAIHPEKNLALRLFRRWVPVTDDFVGDRFFVRRPGVYATPLLVVLLVIETADLFLAVDSIPAVLAITLDVMVVYTSNIFAILGLRSMYFALAGMMEMFEYLHYGLALVLVFIGGKMLTAHYYEMPTVMALGVVAAILVTAVLGSMAFPRKKRA